MKKAVYTLAFLGIGIFAMAQQTERPPMKDQQARKEMMQKKKAEHMAQMEKDLNLTKAQVSQIKAIQDKYQAERKQDVMQNREERRQKMESFRKDRQQMDDEIRKVLTPEQYEKWQAKKQENMEKNRDEMMHKRKKMMETSKDKKWGQGDSDEMQKDKMNKGKGKNK